MIARRVMLDRKRSLKTRINEHFKDINKTSGISIISDHRLNNRHEFDWSEVSILDRESSWQKRSVSEMIHIKRQGHGINKQSDIDLLPDNYLPVIPSLFPSWSFPIKLSLPPTQFFSHCSLILASLVIRLLLATIYFRFLP